MEVHNNLGPGFIETVYKDAIEYEFKLTGVKRRLQNFGSVYRPSLELPESFTKQIGTDRQFWRTKTQLQKNCLLKNSRPNSC